MKTWFRVVWPVWLAAMLTRLLVFFPPFHPPEEVTGADGQTHFLFRAGSGYAFALMYAIGALAGWLVVRRRAGGAWRAALAGASVGVVGHVIVPAAWAVLRYLSGDAYPMNAHPIPVEVQRQMLADTMWAYFGPWGLGMAVAQFAVLGLVGCGLAMLTRRREPAVQGSQA